MNDRVRWEDTVGCEAPNYDEPGRRQGAGLHASRRQTETPPAFGPGGVLSFAATGRRRRLNLAAAPAVPDDSRPAACEYDLERGYCVARTGYACFGNSKWKPGFSWRISLTRRSRLSTVSASGRACQAVNNSSSSSCLVRSNCCIAASFAVRSRW
jgi:hypothetical protein